MKLRFAWIALFLLAFTWLPARAPAAESAAPPAASGDEELMKAGLNALYARRDFAEAIDNFRKVLAHTPSHYGATFQLARALDGAGRTSESRPIWEKVLASAEQIGDWDTAGQARARLPGFPVVVITTEAGVVRVRLNPVRAPITVKNFLEYTDRNFYDETIFHRVIAGFMIQGGGSTRDGVNKPGGVGIANESGNGLLNLRGSIAMARTQDPNSAGSQFFINVVNNAFLDFHGPDAMGYAVFGEVISGMDVVDKIANAPKNADGSPVKPVAILTLRRE